MINDSTFSKSWKGNYKGIEALSDSMLAAIRQNSIASSLQAFEPQKEQYIFLKSHLNELIDTLAQLENIHLAEMSNVLSGDTTVSKADSLFCHQLDSINYLVYKVAINMERIKWEKEYYFDYYLRVNIPSNILKFYSCDTLTLTSKTISGRPETPSPSRLDSRITHFYIFPYWTVPLSIATKEILPKLKISNEYLTKHNMDVLDYKGNVLDIEKINWKKYSEKYFPFKLRQRDGDENTLGVIKFMFSNRYGIYLHDTNARNLFKKEKRALSHGCIRVEQAQKLAGIISNCCVNNFGPDSLEYYLKIKERKQVNLKRPLPIQIRYYTAEADTSSIQFYNDTYFIDRKMINSFINQEEQKPEVVLSSK
jgi:murein L,D-transpeptidase YcbB/YkuD